MLETEDIDDDYFTPASSTSLANIFCKSRKEVGTENESLKYTPPKPVKPEEPKATQCIFACALLGYEWCDGAYIPRGKLGFAILKIIKTGFRNIVLYDSNKITLSCATISKTFEVTVKEHVYFSYHDNQCKYWSLNASEDETNRIIDLLKSFSIDIKYSDECKGPPEVTSIDTFTTSNEQEVNNDKESDTDSSVNRRTKISILNRMASMGQSVLPPRTISTEKTSDSSDTNETSHYKSVRHKPGKSTMKRNSSDKNLPECQSLIEAEKIGSSIIEHTTNSITHSVPLFTYVNGQLVPVTNTSISTSTSNTSGNDLSLFISEQRVSNSEIRINMNRMTDKVDQILGKLSDLEYKDKNNTSNNFQMEMLQKLITEYENKIKMYESFIKAKDWDKYFDTHVFDIVSQGFTKLPKDYKVDKIQKLEALIKEKDEKIAYLENEAKIFHDKYDEAIAIQKKSSEHLFKEIENLKQDIDTKNKELSVNPKKKQELSHKDEDDNIGNKIKTIMNDTYRALSTNFENNEEYSGEKVKAVAAAVIKKVTIESLNNL